MEPARLRRALRSHQGAVAPATRCSNDSVSVKQSNGMSQKESCASSTCTSGSRAGTSAISATGRTANFYPLYCDLDLNPDDYDGTTRERFIEILSSRPPHEQAKIIRGVLEKYSVGSAGIRTRAMHDEYVALADRLARMWMAPERWI